MLAQHHPLADLIPNGNSMSLNTTPRLEIVEQPKSRGFRFRYDCEGQSHGGLPGENSEKNRRQKTYPTVRLIGYRGRARVMVSLVTDTDPPMPHAHSIVGKNTHDGRCIVEMGIETEMYAQFPNMGILHVTKKKVPDVLTRRLLQALKLRNNALLENLDGDLEKGFSEEEVAQVKSQASSASKTMNLSVIRLCFQAFLMDEHGRFTIAVDPVVSHKVYDSKAPSAGNLKICRLDRANGSVKGGDDVFLLCDKVQKNDIEIIFYEDKQDSGMHHAVQPWSAKGRFGPNDVHHQYAIVFQTPPFYNLAVERPVQVLVALRRPSDSELSEPKPFLYLPQEFDEERIGAKRKKKVQHFNNFFDGGTGLGGGGTGGGNMGFFGKGMDMSFSSLFKDQGGGNTGGGGNGQGYSHGGGGGGGGGNTASFPSDGLDALDSFYNPEPSAMSGAGLSDPSFSHSHSNSQYGDFASAGEFGGNISYRPGTQGYQQSSMQYPQQQFNMSDPNYGAMPRGGAGGEVSVKKEKMDADYGDSMVESDGLSRGPPPQGKALIDTEDFESGFQELESNIGQDKPQTEGSEEELQSAQQAVMDRQQAAFVVCERMFNALLAWATTRDVRYLLAAQRSLTAVQNQQGDTALHLAIIHNHQDVVLQLLDVLPQLPPTETPVVDCLNNLKQSPLHLAVLTRQHKVIQYLLKANANPLVCDREGNTPLHLACRMGFVQGTVALLSRANHINAEGCRIPEVNTRNSNGETPLHLAAGCGHSEVLKLLVNARADVDVQDSKSGKTALHHSVEKGDLPMAGYLITEANCNLNCCDFSGNTPLHMASGLGQNAIASLLVAGGADVSILNQEGESPLDHAEYRKNDDIMKLLKEAIEKVTGDEAEDLLSSQMETVSIKQEGDNLSKLDYRARLSLAILLDQNDDWRRLCHLMNLAPLEGGFATFTSPTKDMLSMYQACDGTISQLRQYLVEMKRFDAVNIIDQAMEKTESEQGGEGTSTSSGSAQSRVGKSAPVFGSDHVTLIPRGALVDSGIASHSTSDSLSGLGTNVGPPLGSSSSSPSHATTQA